MITRYISILFMFSFTFSQDISQLTPDQKKEYNRKKLTVEKVTETSGNMGWYWGLFAKQVDTWRAFKGLANQIEPEEFFNIAGYDEEANKVKNVKESSQKKITNGWILYIGGGIAALVPKTETEDLGYGVTYDTVSYPYLLPGTIASLAGLYFVYDGMLNKLKPVAPFQTASDIADEFNIQLIKEITK